MGRRTTAKKQKQPAPQTVQVPIRQAQIRIRALNDDVTILSIQSEEGMSIQGWTVDVEQWREIVYGTEGDEGIKAWVDKERPEKLVETPDLTVVEKPGLILPDGVKPC